MTYNNEHVVEVNKVSKSNESPDDKDKVIKEALEILYAVELLEYHDKNWLSGLSYRRPDRWSLQKQELLSRAIKKCHG